MPFKWKDNEKEYRKQYYLANKERIAKSHRAYYEKHLEKTLAYQMEYARNNRKKINEKCMQYYWKNRTKIREQANASWIKRMYGISREEKTLMLERQDHRCPICETALNQNTAQIDHSHKTNKIRGLLCKPCNLGLGHFDDNPETLMRAACYVEEEI